MRIRSIKPEFWSSEDTARLTFFERLLFIGLWNYVDDNGVGRDVDQLVMAALFPLEKDPHGVLTEVSCALRALAESGLIVRYVADSKPLLYVTGWSHQKINRPSRPRYPLPDLQEQLPSRSTHGGITEDSVSAHAKTPTGSGIRDQGIRGSGESVAGLVAQTSGSSALNDEELDVIRELIGGGKDHARKTVAFILDRAPADVRNAAAYVLTAVKAEPAAYKYRRRNPRPEEFCPEHPGEYADACRACALEDRPES